MHKHTVLFLLLTLLCDRITPYTYMSQTTTYLQDPSDEERSVGSRCIHGSPFSSLPSVNLCCTPNDGVFDSLITDDLLVTGSAIINNLIITGTSFVTNLITDTLCVNGDAVVSGYLTVQNTIDAGYYANDNEAMRVDSHREITNDFNTELIITPTDVILGDDFGADVALDGTGSYAVIGAPSQSVSDEGAVYFYVRSNDTWILVQKEVGTLPLQSFGRAVAISLHGERIAVGGLNTVIIYGKQGGSWVQEAVLTGPVAEAGYGFSVSLSGDGSRLLVGDIDLNLAVGAVYGYKRVQSTCSPTSVQWVLEQTIVNPTATPGDFFGADVSYAQDGMVAVVGVPGANLSSGAVYVYERSSQSGPLAQASAQIVPLVPVPVAQFGGSVSASANGDYFIVGASNPGGLGAGNAYIYERSNQDWIEQQALTGDATALFFGSAVSIAADGSLAVVTNTTSTITQLGAATIFARTNTNWVPIQTITSPFTLDALFGLSASLSQDQSQLLIGSLGLGVVADAAVFYSANCSVVPSCLRVIGDLTVSGTTTFDNDVIISGTIIGNLSVTGTVFADSVVVTGPSTLVVEGDSYFNNQIKAAAGTAAAPTYTFSGALTSGIYAPSAGNVAVATAGTQRLLINSSGVVTVNAAGIAYSLRVFGSTIQPAMSITSLSTGAGLEVNAPSHNSIQASAGTVTLPAYAFNTDSNSGMYSPGFGQLALTASGVNRLTIDSTGSVQSKSSYRLDAVRITLETLATAGGTVIKPNLVTAGSDPLSAYNPATGIYTVPATAPSVGWYLVSASVYFIPSVESATNFVDMIFLTNGVNVTGGSQATVANSSRVPLNYTRLMRLVPGDQLSVSVSWTGGGTLDAAEALTIQLLSF